MQGDYFQIFEKLEYLPETGEYIDLCVELDFLRKNLNEEIIIDLEENYLHLVNFIQDYYSNTNINL